ncbi:MAG TPA: type II secretion system protein [Candidatus Dojkabacteria bacterium]|nr:type II secretion system protein [Candidatus Dojkabacteria bacterium]
MAKAKNFKGFTLIEILVVVALIAILTAITFIAINPAKNFADTRNAQRSSDVTQILNAITQFTSEMNNTTGMLTNPGGVAVPTCPSDGVPTTYIGPSLDAGSELFVVLEPDLVDDYIVGIPMDPTLNGTPGATTGYGYTICQTGATGRITVAAPLAESDKTISVKR